MMRASSIARSQRVPSGRRWLFVFAAAIWLAQLLATLHGLVHVQLPAHDDSASHATHLRSHADRGHANDHGHAGHAPPSALAALFSVHDDETDCRLYDQAGHDVLLLKVAVLALPAVVATCIVDIPRGEALARWAALFQARAPPLF